jgi:hypothetical protein
MQSPEALSLSHLVLTSAPLCPEYVPQFRVHVIHVPSTPYVRSIPKVDCSLSSKRLLADLGFSLVERDGWCLTMVRIWSLF